MKGKAMNMTVVIIEEAKKVKISLALYRENHRHHRTRSHTL
jgi:hypothetical protein